MRYAKFGKLGFEVSRFGMGCMHLPQEETRDGKSRVDEKLAARALLGAICK